MDELALKKFLADCVKLLVDNPAYVEVTMQNPIQDVWEVMLLAHPDDVGKVIGKEGSTIEAIRLLLRNMTFRASQRLYVRAIPNNRLAD